MQERTLTIYFTSDIHGFFYPLDYATGKTVERGLMKCANRFQKDGNTLILDGGDILQGSPFTAYCHDRLCDPEPIARIMNACGYDYVALGNHDFNFGQEYLASYLKALNAQCLCQNCLDDSGKSRYPYTVHVLENGLRVGLVGLVTDHVNVWEKAENLEGCRIVNPFDAAKSALDALQGQVDLTVCLYHGGFERDLKTGALLTQSTENVGYRICEELGFDLLLTGHQHMHVYGRSLRGTYTLQPSEFGREFFKITLTVGQEKQIHAQCIAAEGPCPEELMRLLAPEEEQLQNWLDERVGEMEQALQPSDRIFMASHGSTIAEFFNMVQQDFSGAQISVTSLANEIAGLPKLVRRRDVLTTYPYQNTLKVLEITGQQLRCAMERSAEYFALDANGQITISETFLKPKIEHYNYDYFRGIDYVFDISRPVGQRVVRMRFNGLDVQPSDTFTVCVSDYRASGTGGYPMYPKCPIIREYDTQIADMIMGYFGEHPYVGQMDTGHFQVICG